MNSRATQPAVAFALLALCGLTSLAATPAAAHGRSMSYSTWELDETGARVELRLKEIELTREPPGHAWRQSLPRELVLEANGEPCRAGEATRVRPAPEGWAVFVWRVRCEESGARVIRSQLLSNAVANHTHFVRAETAAGDRPAMLREHLLVTGDEEGFAIDEALRGGAGGAQAGAGGTTPDGEPPPTSIARFVVLGGEHIASGWDHLAFVLALLLLAGTLREVAVLVTSFTAAHSLTLGLAVLGVLRPEATAVEVLIAFSIALVAAENAWMLAGRDRIVPASCVLALLVTAAAAAAGAAAMQPLAWAGLGLFTACHFGLLRGSTNPARLRAALAFAFGLLHGFGFAGVLMDLELPPANLVRALLGFNVGVELGQLVVVALAWPLLRLLARTSAPTERLVAECVSAAIFALGVFWIAERAF